MSTTPVEEYTPRHRRGTYWGTRAAREQVDLAPGRGKHRALQVGDRVDVAYDWRPHATGERVLAHRISPGVIEEISRQTFNTILFVVLDSGETVCAFANEATLVNDVRMPDTERAA